MSIILTPSSDNLNDNKSDCTDTRFGGVRKISQVISSDDYTKRSNTFINKIENPDADHDIDEMNNPMSRKREASRREETSNTQLNNEADFAIKSDNPDNRAKHDISEDNTPVPETHAFKRNRQANRWSIGGESAYDGELR